MLGTAIFFVPLIIILTVGAEDPGRDTVILFSVFGLVTGYIGGSLILNAYYKLTDQLKFKEYEDFKKSQKKST